MNCDICTIITAIDDRHILINGKYWIASVRSEDHTLLGASYVTLKRHAYELDQLTLDEEKELTLIRNSIIHAIRTSFQPITFNISCLKNDAFKADPDGTPPESAHVHWHILPRYGTHPVEFNSKTFLDPMPGQYLSQFDRHLVSHDGAATIAAAVRQNMTTV